MGKSISTRPNQILFDSSDSSAPKGYQYKEASQCIEFCVELDNQDDRLKNSNKQLLRPNIDSTKWNPEPIYDSRLEVAKDVVRFKNSELSEYDQHWKKLYEKNFNAANSKYHNVWDEKTIYNDPDLNGFGPWQNAWLLYEGKGDFKGSFAIAIRGTVFSNSPSAIEDAIFQPVEAKQFLSGYVQFADQDSANLHSGFVHATFTILLDDKYGILSNLKNKNIPDNARLYVVGHSQGAAMSTLVHSFLHYAMRNDEVTNAFGLKGKGYKLKSYAFAQPKPGNYAFSTDFARITQDNDNAIVINNHIDPVPKLPLTLQSTGDLDDDFRGSSFGIRILRFVSGIGSEFRGAFSTVAEPFVRKDAEGYSYFYNYDKIKPIDKDKAASSWDFLPAGHVIMVFGTPGYPSGDMNDLFLQHHATTYRQLISDQLNR